MLMRKSKWLTRKQASKESEENTWVAGKQEKVLNFISVLCVCSFASLAMLYTLHKKYERKKVQVSIEVIKCAWI